MVTPTPLFAAGALRLQHRSFCDADGIRMVSEDGKRAVWLTPEQHSALLNDFADAMRPINRRAKWGFILTIPVTILTLVVTQGLEHILYNSGVRGAYSVYDFLVVTWWPLFLVAYHWAAARRVTSRVEARLSCLPAAPMPTGRPVGFQTLEIVALFIVGPGLLVDIIGSLFPHAFDNTPFMGRGLDAQSIAGLAVFAVLAVRRLRNRRPKEAPAFGASAPEAPMSTGRIARMTARAHTQTASK
jgi:hypothetical protein